MRTAIIVLGVTILLLAVWAMAGERMAVLLDGMLATSGEPAQIRDLSVSGVLIHVGDKHFTLPADLALSLDATHRLVISGGDQAFTLGAALGDDVTSATRLVSMTPEPGDAVTLAVRGGGFVWPTPLERLNYMGTRTTFWRRFRYYRLTWQKASGATLRMEWRHALNRARGYRDWDEQSLDRAPSVVISAPVVVTTHRPQ